MTTPLLALLQDIDVNPDYEVDYMPWVWVGVVFISILIVFFCYQKYIVAKKAAEAKGAARRLTESYDRSKGEEPPLSEDGML